MFIVWWLIIGLIAGALARLLVPGRDPMGWVGTLLLGLVGSLVGGFLANLVFDGEFDVSAAGIIGATIGAIIALLIYRATRNVPTRPVEELAGIRWGNLASFGYFQVAVQEPGRVEFEVRSRDESPPAESDSALLAAGYASVTVLGALEAQPPPPDSPSWIVPV